MLVDIGFLHLAILPAGSILGAFFELSERPANKYQPGVMNGFNSRIVYLFCIRSRIIDTSDYNQTESVNNC